MLDRQPFPAGKNPIGNRASYCNRPVWFAATDADQLLLQTIDDLLAAGDYSNFSDLCKQALRAWLLPDEPQADSVLIVLQQQVVALQLQVNQLSQQLSQEADSAQPITTLEAQLTALMERVTHLEQCKVEAHAPQLPQEFPKEFPKIPVPAVPNRGADPLLDRLVALLEDF